MRDLLCFYDVGRYANLLLKGRHGIFNVRRDVSEFCGAYEGETDIEESVQVLNRGGKKVHSLKLQALTSHY